MEKAQINEITEEITEKPFSSGDVREDLIKWSYKLGALGNLISALAWHEKDGGSESLCSDGELLGSIIYDYAQAIKITTEKRCRILIDIDKAFVSPLPRCQEVYEWLNGRDMLNQSDLEPINYRLKELESFFEAFTGPALDLTGKFAKMRDAIILKMQEEASTAETTAAEA